MSVLDRLSKRHDSVDAVHLIVRELWLDRRDNVIDSVYETAVIVKDRHSCRHLHIGTLSGFFLVLFGFIKPFIDHFGRDIVQLRVKTHNGRVITFLDLFGKSVSEVRHR